MEDLSFLSSLSLPLSLSLSLYIWHFFPLIFWSVFPLDGIGSTFPTFSTASAFSTMPFNIFLLVSELIESKKETMSVIMKAEQTAYRDTAGHQKKKKKVGKSLICPRLLFVILWNTAKGNHQFSECRTRVKGQAEAFCSCVQLLTGLSPWLSLPLVSSSHAWPALNHESNTMSGLKG